MIQTTTIPAHHPLRATIARLADQFAYIPMRLGLPDEPGWLPVAALFSPETPHLERALAQIAESYKTPRRDVPASFFFHRYSWLVACIAFGAYLTDQRLPDLSLSNLAVHLDEMGFTDQIALVSGRFLTTAADPAASHAEATSDAASDLDLAQVRQELIRHFAPVIDIMRTRAPLGKRALWLSLADNCGWCLLEFGNQLQRSGSREAEIAAFLQEPASPLRGRTRLLTVEAEGRTQSFVERGSCCLSYKLPETEHCGTCPLLKPDERYRRLLAAMVAND